MVRGEVCCGEDVDEVWVVGSDGIGQSDVHVEESERLRGRAEVGVPDCCESLLNYGWYRGAGGWGCQDGGRVDGEVRGHGEWRGLCAVALETVRI